MANQELTAKMIDLSKRYNVELSEINRLYNAELIKVTADASIAPENKELATWWHIGLYIENKYGVKFTEGDAPKATPGGIEGFLIGQGDYRDKKAEMVKYIEKQLKDSGKSSCEKRGMIKLEGVEVTFLDYRDQVYGRANPDKGKPLKDVKIDSEMTVYAVARRVESEEPFIYATIGTTNTIIANSWHKSIKFPEHLFVPLKFDGNIKETQIGFKITASASEDKVAAFRVDKDPKYKVEKAMAEAMDPLITPWEWTEDEDSNRPFNPIVTHYELSKGKTGKPAFDRILFLKGLIDGIRPEWKNWKGTPAYLCNPDDVVQRIRIYLPDGFEKQFGEGSLVYAYGKDDEIMQQDDEGKWSIPTGRLSMRCVGVYPIPGLKSTPSEIKSLKEFNAFVG